MRIHRLELLAWGPFPGEVVVDIAYGAVNFPDVLLIANRYQVSAPLPFIPGSEFAGSVSAVGPKVDHLAVGDRVFGAVMVGAFAERMSDWLDQNPAATDAEKLAFAKHLGDSIDNRFGELVQDNLFWRKEGKQLAQIAMVSPTWNIGTLREIGGGLADIVPTAKNLLAGKGLNVSERTAYVAGLAATVALTSSVYQYLKTGQAPQDMRDLVAPRTGGTQRVGGKYGADVPERAAIPGYQKDVYGFLYDFPNHVLQEGINKLNPGPKAIVDLATNTDYQDRPIYPGKIGTAGQNAAAVGSYLADQALPISAGAFQRKKGSKISAAERILGLRESPGYVAAPQITTAQARKREQKAWDWKTSSDKAAARRMESSY